MATVELSQDLSGLYIFEPAISAYRAWQGALTAEKPTWHEIPEDVVGRLAVGKATEGDQMIAYNALIDAQV
jgi:hypothetical protein